MAQYRITVPEKAVLPMKSNLKIDAAGYQAQSIKDPKNNLERVLAD